MTEYLLGMFAGGALATSVCWWRQAVADDRRTAARIAPAGSPASDTDADTDAALVRP